MWWRRLRYVLLLVALCAIATCPAARRACVARTRAAEADQLLAYLADRVAAQVAATGRVPPMPAGPTPKGCCSADEFGSVGVGGVGPGGSAGSGRAGEFGGVGAGAVGPGGSAGGGGAGESGGVGAGGGARGGSAGGGGARGGGAGGGRAGGLGGANGANGANGAGGDGVCSPNAALWAEPGWRALGFSIDGPHRYTYQYVPDASGLSATLRAVADLACDGAMSTVELKLAVVGGTVTRAWSRSAPVR